MSWGSNFQKEKKKKYFVLLLHLRECDYRALLRVEPSEDQTDSVNLFHWVVLRECFFLFCFFLRINAKTLTPSTDLIWFVRWGIFRCFTVYICCILPSWKETEYIAQSYRIIARNSENQPRNNVIHLFSLKADQLSLNQERMKSFLKVAVSLDTWTFLSLRVLSQGL